MDPIVLNEIIQGQSEIIGILENNEITINELLNIFTEKYLILNEIIQCFIILISVIFGLILGSLFIKTLFKN